MLDKFQVLTSVDGRTSLVIEQATNGDRRPKWKVVVPDAGTSSTASKIARLFNQEELALEKIRLARETEEVSDG